MSHSKPAALSGHSDPFEVDQVDLLLSPDNPFRHRITILPSATSTQDILRPTPSSPPTSLPAVLAAEIQTAGHGRQGKPWLSDKPLGLWVSILLEVPADRLPLLSLLGALATADAIRALTGIEPSLKWPNDLLLQNRKLAGLLVETIARPNQTPLALIGLGLNLHQQTTDFPTHLKKSAVSLRQASRRIIPRTQILAAFLESLPTRLAQPIPDALQDWRQLCFHLGRSTRVRTPTEEIIGTAESIDQSGHLHLRLPDGSLLIFTSGETDFPA